MLFQSRNRGTCCFKRSIRTHPHSDVACFNLVIEVLVVSSYLSSHHGTRYISCFNLVIEVLVVSSGHAPKHCCRSGMRFNLVIEVLVVSSISPPAIKDLTLSFQSRNRGTCCFKSRACASSVSSKSSFNLVIEVLVVSRRRSTAAASNDSIVSIS